MRRSRHEPAAERPRYEREGTLVALRPLTVADAEELAAFYDRNRDHLAPFEPRREAAFYTTDYQRRFLEEMARAMEAERGVYWAIVREDRIIGRISLVNIVRYSFQNGILAYAVDEAEQGRGYGTEAVKLAVDFAFAELGLHRVEASTLTDNKRSQGALRANGFSLLGLNRYYLEIDGAWQDHLTYYLTVEDWRQDERP